VLFRSCILGFIGVTFTTWKPGVGGVIGGILTLGTAAMLLLVMRKGRAHAYVLIAALLPWVGYLVAQVVTGGKLGG